MLKNNTINCIRESENTQRSVESEWSVTVRLDTGLLDRKYADLESKDPVVNKCAYHRGHLIATVSISPREAIAK